MHFSMSLNNLFREFLSLFFPRVCAICGGELISPEVGICLRCLYSLPRTFNFRSRENTAECLMAGRINFERIATFCVYVKGGMLPPLIHQLKYHHRKEIGSLMGRMFGEDLKGSDFLDSVECIVPVPLHPRKERIRGYNQAQLIAEGLSQSTHIPVLAGNLIREIYNPTQTRRSRTERWENVRGIFRVKCPQEFKDRHILLVDDVITTGSTLEACGVALSACSGVKISIVTLGEAY